MNIIQIAEEAGFKRETTLTYGYPYTAYKANIERFAALVAAHERENKDKIIEDLTKLLELKTKSEKVAINMIEAAVLAEREACANVCDDEIKSYMSKQYTTDPLGGYRERFAAEQCAAAIRARGEK